MLGGRQLDYELGNFGLSIRITVYPPLPHLSEGSYYMDGFTGIKSSERLTDARMPPYQTQ